ncbi:MAG TPA: hypothetical protein VM164_15000 [Burkholderiales bacterium]|nr:hypothetical protein [Burkholderiales bacterium]
MAPHNVYTKTAKGILEASGKTVTLSAELAAVLLAVDGKASVSDLLALSAMTEPQLVEALDTLEAQGFIEHISVTPRLEAERRNEASPRTTPVNLAQKLTARAAAARKSREQALRERSDIRDSAFGLTPVPTSADPQTAPAAGDTSSDAPHPVPQHVPSALERSVTEAAARARAERIANEKPEDARQGEASSTTPQTTTENATAANAKAAPTLDDTESTRERALVDRTAHDVIADAAEARRRAELAASNSHAAAARKQRAQEDARRIARAAGQRRRRQAAIGTAVALLAFGAFGVAWLQFVPLQSHVAATQRILSARLDQPTTVSAVRYVLFPTPRLILEDVKVGIGQTLRVQRIDAPILPFALMASPLVLDTVEAKGVTIEPAMLAALPSWTGGRSAKSVHLRELRLSDAKVSGADVAPLKGQVRFAANGTVQHAVFVNDNVRVEARPQQNGLRVVLNARDWRVPYGPPVKFSFLTIDGIAEKQQFVTTGLDGRLGGGTLTATLAAKWAELLIVEGTFTLENARLHEMGPPVAALRGTLKANGRYAVRSNSEGGLGHAAIDAVFAVTRGEIVNLDLARALQSAGLASSGGGRTGFEVLTGSVRAARGHYTFRQLQLASGPLHASGSLDVSPSSELNGGLNASFGVPGAAPASLALIVSGTAQEPLLRRLY